MRLTLPSKYLAEEGGLLACHPWQIMKTRHESQRSEYLGADLSCRAIYLKQEGLVRPLQPRHQGKTKASGVS
jgi:hypothetical protein